jgi:4-aminobutyrate aminotransferase-like enzyme
MERVKLAEQAATKGEKLMERLRGLGNNRIKVGEVRGQGLMVGAELVKDLDSKEPAGAETAQLRTAARERKVLVGAGGLYGNVLRIQPPLTISDDELDQVVSVLEECFAEL